MEGLNNDGGPMRKKNAGEAGDFGGKTVYPLKMRMK